MKRIILCMAVSILPQIAPAETGPRTDGGFRIPSENYRFSFPRDHGSHPDFKIEWWYITGHLRDSAKQRFGYQATFFRYALSAYGIETAGLFGTNQLYMAHMALSDINGRRFFQEERLNRNGWDAMASTNDLALKNGNWMLRRTTNDVMHLQASIRSDVLLDLKLKPLQPPVIFGNNGLSKKGAEDSACSWYITFPRLKTTGRMELYGREMKLTGESWMDHEISSSQLGREQVGWDWISIRFDDGQEMMVYILRDANGIPDPYSTLVWIAQDGSLHHVNPDQFRWSSSGVWTSPDTGTRYPIDGKLEGRRPDGRPFSFTIKPLLRQQELVGKLGGISYWEGACDIFENDQCVGEAYMELTGYGKSLKESL